VTTTLGRHRSSRPDALFWWLGYASVMGVAMMIAAVARRRLGEPYLGLSLAAIAVVVTFWLVRPRAALYIAIAATTTSDLVTVSWFPFVKNLSSRESISFVADAATISPLDLVLVSGVAISMLRMYASTGRWIARNSLIGPTLLFTAMVLYGFARGFTNSGDLRIAVLTGRPLFYVGAVFVLVVNECPAPEHRRRAIAAAGIGVLVQALLSIEYLGRLDPATRDSLEGLTEHGSVLGQNAIILALVIVVLFRLRQRLLTVLLAIVVLPVGYVYLVGQRRAGIAAILIAGVLTAFMLFWRHRRRFWVMTPTIGILFAGYVVAFWNSNSSAAFPAQAVRTVIAPNSASAKDRSSDLYRLAEAFDLTMSIRSDPLFGFGFGRAFLRPIPLPDISAFELNAYQPHNSVLWIWVTLGFGGFAAMFYLFARTIIAGTDLARRTELGIDFVIVWIATMYVAMYAVYSWVDVSWDARNTLLLGLAVAIAGGVTADQPTQEDEEIADGEASETSLTTSAKAST
jgi:hypothetical protein